MIEQIECAVRAYTERLDREHRQGSRNQWKALRQDVLVFDTETTIDELQHLTFGSYRQCEWADEGPLLLVEEGLFYADDLPDSDPAGYAALLKYVEAHPDLTLCSKTDFLEDVFYPVAYQAQALVVGFNLAFDLMRLAVSWGEGRGQFYGGFSCVFWQVKHSATGELIENPWLPRVLLKLVDSKRAFIQFAKPLGGDPKELGVADSKRHPIRQQTFRGNFLDLRTLAFALTSESHSLESACKVFGVEHSKTKTEEHGRITEDYIEYNRRDVLATSELLVILMDQFLTHPIGLDPCKAFSPASIAKAYMRALGVRAPFKQFPDLPKEFYGIAMSSYYGGRADNRIRKVPVPVVHTDFVSMYPTVNSLMGLWNVLTAEALTLEECTDEMQALLDGAAGDNWFDPIKWRTLTWFGEVVPDDDVLPFRGQYDSCSDALNIGVSRVTSSLAMWYTGPDLVASAILAGKPPCLKRAIRIVPLGRQALNGVMLGGAVTIDPMAQDFFQTLIEERKKAEADTSLSADQKKRVSQALKILANSGSYGIFAEINRDDLPKDERVPVRVHGLGGSFEIQTPAPESPGEFCFPPLASLVTGGARLMLALLERAVSQRGGSYAFCDTDSMAIVATKAAGSVRVPGGNRLTKGKPAVRTLSWREVEEVVALFEPLNPYDRAIVSGSILEIKPVNFDDAGVQRRIKVFAIAAKRYAFYSLGRKSVEILECSEHGLGHLMSPLKAGDESTDWIRLSWQSIVSRAHEIRLEPLSFLEQPALTRISISSPYVLRPFAKAQFDLPFDKKIRPTNFLLSAITWNPPAGPFPVPFHLLRPFSTDSKSWLDDPWIELYSGAEIFATTRIPAEPYEAGIRSFGDVLEEYEFHPEAKAADSNGQPCERGTVGLLQRRHVAPSAIVFIGKETNRLEEVQQGLIHDWEDALCFYINPDLDTWRSEVIPALKKIACAVLAKASGKSERTIRSIRNGHSTPSAATKAALMNAISDRTRDVPARAKAQRRASTKKARRPR